MKVPAGKSVLIGAAIAVVVGAVVGGLVALPSPSEERTRRLDERRVEDLRGITRAMDLYWTRHGRLPASMEDLSRESDVRVSVRDPGTGQDYELRVLDAATYELCASFERASGPRDTRRWAPIPGDRRRDANPADSGDPAGLAEDVSEDFWSHGVGRRCFRLDAQEVPSREKRQP